MVEGQTQALRKEDVSSREKGTMDTSDYYSFYADCSNCGFGDKVWIRKGFLIVQALCPECGCLNKLQSREK